MTTDTLALTRPDPSLTMDVLRAQMAAAKRFVDSGLLPSGIKTPQQALTIMQAGREIGVPATYALRNIHVIEGKPTCSAELLMALVRRTYGQAAIRVKEATNEACTVEYREQGWDGVSSLTFSIEDAKKAGLAGKQMWGKYPRAMLRSRAVSEAVRTAFPECIAGLYTAEEMGADVVVASDGSLEIQDATPPPPNSGVVEGEVIEPGATEPEFHYGDVRKRYEAAAEYERLANLATERGHKHAKMIKAKRVNDLSDQELAVAVGKLLTWEQSLAPQEKDLVDAF